MSDPITPSLVKKIAISLATRFDLSVADIQLKLKKATIKQYGKVRWLEGGDVINAALLVPASDDRRDTSFVQVKSYQYIVK